MKDKASTATISTWIVHTYSQGGAGWSSSFDYTINVENLVEGGADGSNIGVFLNAWTA